MKAQTGSTATLSTILNSVETCSAQFSSAQFSRYVVLISSSAANVVQAIVIFGLMILLVTVCYKTKRRRVRVMNTTTTPGEQYSISHATCEEHIALTVNSSTLTIATAPNEAYAAVKASTADCQACASPLHADTYTIVTAPNKAYAAVKGSATDCQACASPLHAVTDAIVTAPNKAMLPSKALQLISRAVLSPCMLLLTSLLPWLQTLCSF